MKQYLNSLAKQGLVKKDDLEDRARIVQVLIRNVEESKLEPKKVEKDVDDLEDLGEQTIKKVKKRQNKKERFATLRVVRIIRKIMKFFRRAAKMLSFAKKALASPALVLMEVYERIVAWLHKVVDKLFGTVIRIFRYLLKYIRLWFTSPVKAFIFTFLIGFGYWKATNFLEEIFTAVSGAVKDLIQPVLDTQVPHETVINKEITSRHPTIISEDTLTRSDTATVNRVDNKIVKAEHRANMQALVDRVLDPILDRFAGLRVSSGYRGEELNRLVGGTEGSQHALGQAVDLACGPGQQGMLKGLEVVKWLNDNFSIPFDQAILEFNGSNWWVHVSHVRGGRNRGQILYCPNANSGHEIYYKLDFTQQETRYINGRGEYQQFAMPE